MITIEIRRHRIGNIACDGTLSIDGLRICDTAEHSLYRTPTGCYRVALRRNRLMGRKAPTLLPMEGDGAKTECGYLAIGNGIYTTRNARILLGTYIAPGCLRHSYSPFKLLYDRINNGQRRGHEVILKITE